MAKSRLRFVIHICSICRKSWTTTRRDTSKKQGRIIQLVLCDKCQLEIYMKHYGPGQ